MPSSMTSQLRSRVCAVSILACALSLGVHVAAQRGGGPRQPAGSPKEAATIDVTGYWVSIVSEDWLSRMLMPPRGDYAGVP